jgi:hypothetical protein
LPNITHWRVFILFSPTPAGHAWSKVVGLTHWEGRGPVNINCVEMGFVCITTTTTRLCTTPSLFLQASNSKAIFAVAIIKSLGLCFSQVDKLHLGPEQSKKWWSKQALDSSQLENMQFIGEHTASQLETHQTDLNSIYEVLLMNM